MEKRNKTKNSKSIVICLIIALCFVCCLWVGLSVNSNTTAIADCEVVANDDTFEQFFVGDEFIVPNATIKYNDIEMLASKYKVVYPNGDCSNAAKIRFNTPGKYSIIYFADYSGQTYSGTKSFDVLNSAYSVGENSTVKYGINDKLGDTISGLTVSLAEGEVFTYNKPIDVSDAKKLSNLISIIPLPETLGSIEANEIFVKLTDAYNPDNYVLIKTLNNSKYATSNSYQMAGATSQALTGIQVVGSSSLVYKNACYDLRIGTDKGYETTCALDAVNGYGKNILSLSLDYGEREVYGSAQYNTNGGDLIVDLDNSLFFIELWEGFAMGECYLSVYADSYVGSKCNFMISEIYEQDLSIRNYSEERKPIVNVDYDDSVYAIVGNKFKIFDYQAMDINGVYVDCKVRVSYNSMYAVKLEDNAFIPARSGIYCISYELVGQSGLTTTKNIYIPAYEQDEIPLEIEFNNINVGNSGEVFNIDKPKITGTSGKYSLTIVATLKKDSNVYCELTETEVGYEFLPLYAGEYLLECKITDYNGTTIKTQTIDVGVGDFVVVNKPYFADYFINGAEYSIQKLQCYELSTGTPISVETEIFYSFDGGTYNQLNAKSLKIEADDYVTIRYIYQSELIEEFVVDVVDIGYGTYSMRISDMFVSEDGTVEISSELASATSTTFLFNNAKASVFYINKILVSDFSLSFTPSDYNYSVLNIELYNYDASIIMSFVASNDGTEIYLNGQLIGAMTENLNETSYLLRYSELSGKLIINSYSFEVENRFGKIFSDMMAYLRISCDIEIDATVDTPSKLTLNKINNQVMSSTASDDYTAPQIFTKMEGCIKSKGEVISIKDIYFADVISPDVQCFYNVRDNKGVIVSSIDGVILQSIDYNIGYEFELSAYGSYSIEIVAIDNMNNTATKIVTFLVSDSVAPIITIDTGTISGTTGNKIKVKSFDVSDNLNDESDLVILTTYIAPNGGKYIFKNSFIPNETGTYVVMITAVDKSGNMANKFYKIIVS